MLENAFFPPVYATVVTHININTSIYMHAYAYAMRELSRKRIKIHNIFIKIRFCTFNPYKNLYYAPAFYPSYYTFLFNIILFRVRCDNFRIVDRSSAFLVSRLHYR